MKGDGFNETNNETSRSYRVGFASIVALPAPKVSEVKRKPY